MFDDFDSFDQAFAPVGVGETSSGSVRPLKKRKSLKEKIFFWTLNLILLPVTGICYLTVGAEGLRKLMSIFAMRLYKLPIPGAEFLQDYSGFDKLDIAMLAAIVLFTAVTILWVRIFRELQSSDRISQQRRHNPILFFLLAGIAAIIIFGDAGIFYIGLKSQTSNGWTDTPAYVPAVATILYTAGLALLGAWHADFHYSSGAV